MDGLIDLISCLERTGSEEDRLPTRSSRRIELLADRLNAPSKAFLNDRPSMIGDVFIFVSTEEDVGKPVQGWNAVYSLNFITSVVKRLTPPGITDYSPAVSPSGNDPALHAINSIHCYDVFEILVFDINLRECLRSLCKDVDFS